MSRLSFCERARACVCASVPMCVPVCACVRACVLARVRAYMRALPGLKIMRESLVSGRSSKSSPTLAVSCLVKQRT